MHHIENAISLLIIIPETDIFFLQEKKKWKSKKKTLTQSLDTYQCVIQIAKNLKVVCTYLFQAQHITLQQNLIAFVILVLDFPNELIDYATSIFYSSLHFHRWDGYD